MSEKKLDFGQHNSAGVVSCIRRVNLLSIFHSMRFQRKKFRTFEGTFVHFERENFWKNDDFVVILYFEKKRWAFVIEFWMKFVLWAKKFRTLPKFYCRFPKLQSTCQEKNCERERNWKNDDSLVILKLWVKKLDSEQNNWAGVVKTTFGVSRGILWQFFIEKRLVFHVFLHFEQNHWWLLPKIYGRVFETSIYVSGEKFWERKTLKKRRFLSNFVLWVKKNWILGKIIVQGLS